MAQDDKYNKNFTQKKNPVSKSQTSAMGDWQDEHGNPDFTYLQSLVDDGSPEALERLRSIAGDLDVDFSEDTPNSELVEKIRLATMENEDVEPEVTD